MSRLQKFALSLEALRRYFSPNKLLLLFFLMLCSNKLNYEFNTLHATDSVTLH